MTVLPVSTAGLSSSLRLGQGRLRPQMAFFVHVPIIISIAHICCTTITAAFSWIIVRSEPLFSHPYSASATWLLIPARWKVSKCNLINRSHQRAHLSVASERFSIQLFAYCFVRNVNLATFKHDCGNRMTRLLWDLRTVCYTSFFSIW